MFHPLTFLTAISLRHEHLQETLRTAVFGARDIPLVFDDTLRMLNEQTREKENLDNYNLP